MGRSSNSYKSPKQDQAALLDHALAYARRGWSIIPVAGKKPLGLWRPFQQEPADILTLRRLFDKPGVTGLAVITGRVSGGLAVRDFDLVDVYHAWAKVNPEDASSLPTVRTTRGFHVYGRLDEEVFADIGDGELRANAGHYVLLPPSRHPDGPIYSWLTPLSEAVLPLLPASLTAQRGGEQPRHTQQTQATQQPKQHIACVPQVAVDAIEATLPDGPGKRNRKVFDLARRLKGIAGLDTSPAMLNALVAEWHRRALPVIRTKDFAETWSDFQTAWLAVRTPHRTTVRAAYEAARRAPRVCIDGSADLGVLAALCRNLSAAAGGPFYLACRTVEELFGVSRMTAWRWLQALQFYEVIAEVEKGALKPRQATTWRFTGKR